MNEKLKLTQRDKKLLFLLFVILTLYAYFNLLLIPLLNKKSNLENTLESSKLQQESMVNTILTDSYNKSAYKNISEEFEEKKSHLKYMTNEQINTLMSSLCQQCFLQQTNFSLFIKDHLDLNDSDKIVVAQINLNLSGDTSNLLSFVDAVDKVDNLFINNFSISDFANTQNYSISLDLYMLNGN